MNCVHSVCKVIYNLLCIIYRSNWHSKILLWTIVFWSAFLTHGKNKWETWVGLAPMKPCLIFTWVYAVLWGQYTRGCMLIIKGSPWSILFSSWTVCKVIYNLMCIIYRSNWQSKILLLTIVFWSAFLNHGKNKWETWVGLAPMIPCLIFTWVYAVLWGQGNIGRNKLYSMLCISVKLGSHTYICVDLGGVLWVSGHMVLLRNFGWFGKDRLWKICQRFWRAQQSSNEGWVLLSTKHGRKYKWMCLSNIDSATQDDKIS